MPARVRVQAGDVEREIRAIRDPELRAARAAEAHRQARELALRLSIVRRDAFMDLHDAGRTWQEVADTAGMSLKATIKAVHGAGEHENWWKRLPADVAESVKRGPGGMARAHVLPRTALMEVVVDTMSEAEHASRELGRGAARVSPAQLIERASAHFGKPVSRPSLSAALFALIDEGRVARVGHGRYVLTKVPASARHADKRPAAGPRSA